MSSSCVQMFSVDTLRELDASAYEEAPPLAPEELAEETGRPSSDTGHPRSIDRSLGSRRHSLGESSLSLSVWQGLRTSLRATSKSRMLRLLAIFIAYNCDPGMHRPARGRVGRGDDSW